MTQGVDSGRRLTPTERCGIAGAIVFALVSLLFILAASPDAERGGPRAATHAAAAGAPR